MNTTPTTENNRDLLRKRIILFLSIFSGILVITNIYLLILLFNQKQKTNEQVIITKEVIVERDNVKASLEELKKQYEELKTDNADLQKEIDEKKTYIDELLKEAEKHKNDAAIIAKLKKETETLRQIMKGYVRTIDSLNTLNQKLVEEKNVVEKKLGEKETVINEMSKKQEELKSTIEKGSILSCMNIKAIAVQLKKGGKKESETTRAKRANKIKVSFSLGENKIAKAGPRDIYVRIMTPDGKEMAKEYSDLYKFTFNKTSSGYFAGTETIQYANQQMDVVVYCEGSEPFVPGTYIIDIVCDGFVIGNTTLKLD
ncbi:MAG: hypothetical protein KatS3mg027_0069 [Bacteroidia bacterium]|nr:MAG: hypothetical protein KatS3mg027_0069 [Bacteroidia bacterium]